MEPFKPEQIFYLKRLVREISNYLVADHGMKHAIESLDALPRYFCQNQIWHEKIRNGNTGATFSAMVCLKYRAVCNVVAGNAASCCDYLPFEQTECGDGTCKI